ncbi:hypothetical protein X759_36335 [Mesorhizobium sp. LSHC420B00]|nr:hypothetical protein X759_36335 [Mesorhizobium sp. LSHC420B00]
MKVFIRRFRKPESRLPSSSASARDSGSEAGQMHKAATNISFRLTYIKNE